MISLSASPFFIICLHKTQNSNVVPSMQGTNHNIYHLFTSLSILTNLKPIDLQNDTIVVAELLTQQKDALGAIRGGRGLHSVFIHNALINWYNKTN